MSPLVSLLKHEGLIEAIAVHQRPVFEAGVLFARAEGIIPAPESSHAICAAILEARKAKEEGKPKVILFNLSGHGHFDMGSYARYLSGDLEDYEYPADRVSEALAAVPKVAATG
jgi:predicted alternative tryptophan synthase beta-subunit